MRWCRIRHEGRAAAGIVEDEHVALVDGDPFTGHRRTGVRVASADAVFLPPVIPPTFYAVGYNYRAHNAHAAARTATAAPAPERPEVGYRAQSALIGHGAAVVKPADCTGPFECEAELVAVLGRDLRRASRDEAADAVFGWTIGNDVSARTWQRADRTLWRAKNSDTFKPMGPWIETDADPLAEGVTTAVAVDGEQVAAFPTGAMVFDPYAYIQEISRYITLRAGDVLWMGTDAMLEMPVGSTLAISITGLGTLANPVTEEP